MDKQEIRYCFISYDNEQQQQQLEWKLSPYSFEDTIKVLDTLAPFKNGYYHIVKNTYKEKEIVQQKNRIKLIKPVNCMIAAASNTTTSL